MRVDLDVIVDVVAGMGVGVVVRIAGGGVSVYVWYFSCQTRPPSWHENSIMLS